MAQRGLLVTGTDTGVGKTEVGCALAWMLTKRGVRVRPRKPVESGCHRHDAQLLARDAERLRSAALSADPIEAVCPFPLEAALSPERAARLAGVNLSLDLLADACARGGASGDFLLVEGAGGLLAPLAPRATVADLAARLALPVLLVVPDRLGCLNHTLLTVEAIARRNLTLAGVVLNRLQPAHPADMDNAADLRGWLARDVVELPYAAELDPPWSAWRVPLAPLIERIVAGTL